MTTFCCRVHPLWAAIVASHATASSSSAECRLDQPPASFISGQESTMWDIVCGSPQAHRPVTVSSGRHRYDPVQCGSNSGETTVIEGGQNLVVRLWGQPLSRSWPLKPNLIILSTDLWRLLNKNLATDDSWMTIAVVLDKVYHSELDGCFLHKLGWGGLPSQGRWFNVSEN